MSSDLCVSFISNQNLNFAYVWNTLAKIWRPISPLQFGQILGRKFGPSYGKRKVRCGNSTFVFFLVKRFWAKTIGKCYRICTEAIPKTKTSILLMFGKLWQKFGGPFPLCNLSKFWAENFGRPKGGAKFGAEIRLSFFFLLSVFG